MRAKLQSFILLISLGLLPGCSQGPVAWWRSVDAKVRHLTGLEASHLALRQEHDRLKQDYYRLEAEYLELKAKVESNEKGDRNLRATGTVEGRAPSSIAYEPPQNLRSEDSLALAYEHFKEKRFAEAAVTFEDFFKKPESAALVDANAMYTAGVAWFQLGNFLKAREHLEDAKQAASGEQRERIHKKVDLWMRAIDRRAGESPDKRGPASVKAGVHDMPSRHAEFAVEKPHDAHETHHGEHESPPEHGQGAPSARHHNSGGKLGD